MTIKTITKKEILALISQMVVEQVAKGFVVTEGFTSNSWPQFYLRKGNEKIKVETETKHKSHFGENEYSEVNTVEINLITEAATTTTKFYTIEGTEGPFKGVYVSTESELNEIEKVQRQRRNIRYAKVENKELSVRPLLPLIRKIPGFKTVAIKNLRVTRLNSKFAYKIENMTTSNKKIIAYK